MSTGCSARPLVDDRKGILCVEGLAVAPWHHPGGDEREVRVRPGARADGWRHRGVAVGADVVGAILRCAFLASLA
eukprot:6207403-Pleurochrysis_carterae.AAC.1